MTKRYEQFPHTADIGVRVFGGGLKELFENAAFAMFDLLADLEGLKGDIIKDFEIKAPNKEELLVDWLDELLFNFYTNEIIFYKFEVEEISETRLKAKAFGRPIAANRNRLKTEIKAATYSDLNIMKTDSGFQVEIIFDV
ncbi:MAG: archease [Candidatus Omnitrophota bacterium]